MVEYLTSAKSDINLWKQRHCICMSWNRYDSVGTLIFLSLGGFKLLRRWYQCIQAVAGGRGQCTVGQLLIRYSQTYWKRKKTPTIYNDVRSRSQHRLSGVIKTDRNQDLSEPYSCSVLEGSVLINSKRTSPFLLLWWPCMDSICFQLSHNSPH